MIHQVSRTALIALALLASTPVAAQPARALPGPDFPLNRKNVDQWIVLMTGLQELADTDPALLQRVRNPKYQLVDRTGDAGATSRGWDLEKIAADEPKVQALLARAGIKRGEANGLTVACVAAAMTLTLKQRGVAVPTKVPAANLEAVRPKHAEIMQLVGRLQQGGSRRGAAGRE
jgi:hypothetical protein